MRIQKIITLFLLSFSFVLSGLAQQVSPPDGNISNYGYVDLGLPSGVRWATCNVGAASPADYGGYYAWGETSVKAGYDKDNCKTWGRTLGNISGNAAHDAARAAWGGSWRLPAKAEFDELTDKCIWTWTSLNGHNGYMVKGPSGKSIFLPASGLRHGTSLDKAGEGSIYWSATTDEDSTSACGLAFDRESRSMPFGFREYGRPVRAVSDPPLPGISGHEYVDLGLPSGVKWAACNVGAASPADYGDYYAWGEIRTKQDYDKENGMTWEKTMGGIGGHPSYDAARAGWGAPWRLPAKAEMEELLEKCTWTWAERNGHNGYVVKGPNGNTIFLPAAGGRNGASLYCAGEYGFYWSASPCGDGTGADGLRLNAGGGETGRLNRFCGYPVRAVAE